MPQGVIDGQSVDQTITNAAFLFKNGNDTSSGVYTLNAPTSGPQINDLQNTINVILNGVGGTQSTAATAYAGVPSNTVFSGDTANTAITRLADKFYGAATAGGHSHSGMDGDGAPVSAVLSIAPSGGVPITGNVILAATGFADVQQVGQTIFFAGLAPGLPDVLAVNNSASAGFDMAGGAIIDLSYTDWENAGFPPGNPASGHVYFAPSANGFFYKRNSSGTLTRVEATIAVSGQSAIYGDAILIPGTNTTLSQSGQNITINSAASGSAVNSIAASGSAGLSGAVILAAGSNVTLSESGQIITINSTASAAASGNITVFGSRASPILVPASGITFTGSNPLNLIFVVGSGGAVAVTGTTSIVNANAFVGQQLQIISTSAASTVTLSDSATGSNLRGEWVGDDIAGLTVVYDGSNFYEMARR